MTPQSRLRRRPLPLFGAAALLAASLGACVSLLPVNKPAALYTFGLAAGAATPPSQAARGVILEPVSFPREAMNDGILTIEGPEVSYLANARWSASAPVLFRQALGRAFDATASARLLNRGEQGRAVALLEVEVVRFEADYTAPKSPPTAHVTLRVSLSRIDGTPIDTTVVDVETPAAENRVGAIVAAYDSTADKALNNLAHWVDDKVKAIG